MSESSEAAKRAAEEAFTAKTSSEVKTLIETGFDPHEGKKLEEQREFDAVSHKDAMDTLADLASDLGEGPKKTGTI